MMQFWSVNVINKTIQFTNSLKIRSLLVKKDYLTAEITTVKSTVRLTSTTNDAIKDLFYLYETDSLIITKFQKEEKCL